VDGVVLLLDNNSPIDVVGVVSSGSCVLIECMYLATKNRTG